MADLTTSLDNRDMRILNDLHKMAMDVPPVQNARLAAAVAIRATVLAFRHNQLKSHPFHRTYGKNEDSLFWHAETHAIHNFIRRNHPDDLHRATLYVARVKRPTITSRDFILGMARPCRGCMKCIEAFGIPRIVYSTNDSNFMCELAA